MTYVLLPFIVTLNKYVLMRLFWVLSRVFQDKLITFLTKESFCQCCNVNCLILLPRYTIFSAYISFLLSMYTSAFTFRCLALIKIVFVLLIFIPYVMNISFTSSTARWVSPSFFIIITIL